MNLMSHVTGQLPFGTLRSRLNLLLHQYRPVLALEDDQLRAAMRDFERDLSRKSAPSPAASPIQSPVQNPLQNQNLNLTTALAA